MAYKARLRTFAGNFRLTGDTSSQGITFATSDSTEFPWQSRGALPLRESAIRQLVEWGYDAYVVESPFFGAPFVTDVVCSLVANGCRLEALFRSNSVEFQVTIKQPFHEVLTLSKTWSLDVMPWDQEPITESRPSILDFVFDGWGSYARMYGRIVEIARSLSLNRGIGGLQCVLAAPAGLKDNGLTGTTLSTSDIEQFASVMAFLSLHDSDSLNAPRELPIEFDLPYQIQQQRELDARLRGEFLAGYERTHRRVDYRLAIVPEATRKVWLKHDAVARAFSVDPSPDADGFSIYADLMSRSQIEAPPKPLTRDAIKRLQAIGYQLRFGRQPYVPYESGHAIRFVLADNWSPITCSPDTVSFQVYREDHGRAEIAWVSLTLAEISSLSADSVGLICDIGAAYKTEGTDPSVLARFIPRALWNDLEWCEA
ncbi:hypothetical protein [Lysobacter sp. HA18]